MRRAASAPIAPAEAFQRVWARTDGVVAAGAASRPWVWGPAIIYEGEERYGSGTRPVQYFAKGRLEVTNANLPETSPALVTNGQLVVELVSGELEIGPGQVETFVPADIPVVGDATANPHAPTYASLRFVASLNGGRRVPPRIGQAVTETIARDGYIGSNPHVAGRATMAAYSQETGHNIPDVFVNYLASTGLTAEASGMAETTVVDAPFTTGFPITEPYWTQIQTEGGAADVMFQLFERRTLLFWPSRPPGFQVEMGDVGRHYFEWRYHTGVPGGQPATHKSISVVVTSVTLTTNETGPLPTPAPAPPAPEGETRRGRVTPTPTPAPQPIGLTTTGLFVIVELEATNVGKATTKLPLEEFILVDSLGRRYEVSREATKLAAQRLGREAATAELRPGFTEPLVRVFEVAADASGLIMAPAYGEKPSFAVQ